MQKTSAIIAVILCGGESTRMGKNKALLHYHKIPQYQYLSNLCHNLDLEVFLSCKTSQVPNFKASNNFVIDEEQFENAGPMTGLLSAMKAFPNAAILLLACDYPYLNESAIEKLVKAFGSNQKSVCYFNKQSQMNEPVLAIYHPSNKKLLEEAYRAGTHSLQQILKGIKPVRVEPNEAKIIKSFDTPADFESFAK